MNKLIQKVTPPQFLSNRFLLIFILILYIMIGHILLPVFNKTDIFPLFSWRLFAYVPKKFVHDLTWDQGKTFLTRDHKENLRSIEEKFILRFLLGRRDINRIRKDYKAQLLKLCQCESIQFVKLKGSFTDHFIHKKELETVETTEL